MQDQRTTFLLGFAFQHRDAGTQLPIPTKIIQQDCPLTSKQLFQHLFYNLTCSENYRDDRKHRLSLSSDDTGSHTQPKCNCKKSKCLKLYCECFAQGSFCKGCNCECCHNTEDFSQIRAKAIDEMLMRTTLNFGQKGSAIRGCNCKKTGCVKKYCECFNSGEKCGPYCKCNDCANCE